MDQLSWNGKFQVVINGSYDESVRVRASVGVQKKSRTGNNCTVIVTAPAGKVTLNILNLAGRFDIHTLRGEASVLGDVILTTNEPNHKVGFTKVNGTSFLFSTLKRGNISLYLAQQ